MLLGPFSDREELIPVQGIEAKHQEPGKELIGYGKGGVFRGGCQQGDSACLEVGEEEVLLGLAEAMQLVQDQGVALFQLTAEIGEPGFRGADPDEMPVQVPGQKESGSGFPAAGRAEEKDARKALLFLEVGQFIPEASLADKLGEIRGPEDFRQGFSFAQALEAPSKVVEAYRDALSWSPESGLPKTKEMAHPFPGPTTAA
jgi:hypothetical protein